MSSTNRGDQRSPTDFYGTPGRCVHRLLECLELPGGYWFEPELKKEEYYPDGLREEE